MESGSRESWADALRVLAAYLVVALHCVSDCLSSGYWYGARSWWACSLINSAARMGVPLFFMLSGYLLLRDRRTLDVRSFYARRLKRLLPPFLIWNAVCFAAGALRSGEALSAGRFLRELAFRGSGYHLWFIYEILAMYLLSPFLKRLLDGCRRREGWLFLLLLLLPCTVFPFLNTVLPVYIAPLPLLADGYAGFFVFGYLLGTAEPPRGRAWALWLCLAGGVAVSAAGNYLLSSPENMALPFNNGYMLTHYLTAGPLFLLARMRPPAGRAADALRRLAGVSFGVYLAHPLALESFQDLLRAAGLALTPVWEAAAVFTLTSVAVTSLMLLLSRSRRLGRLLM